ncbi:Cyclin [Macleaya cordata]|uniref:Cyclin n=1 Tax=Macleaya cordata TaxID=56857 RepID=A0A200R521_MACCD|nr:Cyclin [Macleaya cordata]
MAESSLLCDEENWLISTSPSTTHPRHYPTTHKMLKLAESCMGSSSSSSSYFYTTREDCWNAFMVCLQKEVDYMPEAGYVNDYVEHLQSSGYLHARSRAIQWFVKCHRRLNLSVETVFSAANYFDRFVSINHCNNKWEHWTIELLSVVCLSIAAKFIGEVSIPSLHQLHQMEDDDLDNSFQPYTIQQMELRVLKALGWRLSCVTAYSYLELLMHQLDSLQPDLHLTITSRVTELLLGTLSDLKFTEFRPSTIAVSALRCCLEEILPSKSNAYLSDLTSLIPQDQMSEIVNCHKIMEERVADPLMYTIIACGCSYFPSSPVTVMTMEAIDIYTFHVDLSLVKDSRPISNPKKRKREEDMLSNSKTQATVGVRFRDCPSQSFNAHR